MNEYLGLYESASSVTMSPPSQDQIQKQGNVGPAIRVFWADGSLKYPNDYMLAVGDLLTGFAGSLPNPTEASYDPTITPEVLFPGESEDEFPIGQFVDTCNNPGSATVPVSFYHPETFYSVPNRYGNTATLLQKPRCVRIIPVQYYSRLFHNWYGLKRNSVSGTFVLPQDLTGTYSEWREPDFSWAQHVKTISSRINWTTGRDTQIAFYRDCLSYEEYYRNLTKQLKTRFSHSDIFFQFVPTMLDLTFVKYVGRTLNRKLQLNGSVSNQRFLRLAMPNEGNRVYSGGNQVAKFPTDRLYGDVLNIFFISDQSLPVPSHRFVSLYFKMLPTNLTSGTAAFTEDADITTWNADLDLLDEQWENFEDNRSIIYYDEVAPNDLQKQSSTPTGALSSTSENDLADIYQWDGSSYIYDRTENYLHFVGLTNYDSGTMPYVAVRRQILMNGTTIISDTPTSGSIKQRPMVDMRAENRDGWNAFLNANDDVRKRVEYRGIVNSSTPDEIFNNLRDLISGYFGVSI